MYHCLALLHHFTSSEVFLSFLLLSMTFLNVTFSAFFFYLLLIYLKLVGCLPSACFLIWSPGLDCSREENFSSLKLSIKMRHFLSPSPRPHFGPFGSLSLPALLYLVLVLVLSPHLPPSTKESSILWSYFALFLLTLEATNTCKIYFCRCMFHMWLFFTWSLNWLSAIPVLLLAVH